jgi:hypothetical protein
MCARKAAQSNPQRLAPIVNIAPLGELNAYTVHEHELDRIAEGSTATLAFNGSVALLSLGFCFLLTLTTATITISWLFSVYLFFCINFILVGVLLLIYWWRTRTSVRAIVTRIKSRMPPPVGIQEQPSTVPPASGTESRTE